VISSQNSSIKNFAKDRYLFRIKQNICLPFLYKTRVNFPLLVFRQPVLNSIKKHVSNRRYLMIYPLKYNSLHFSVLVIINFSLLIINYLSTFISDILLLLKLSVYQRDLMFLNHSQQGFSLCRCCQFVCLIDIEQSLFLLMPDETQLSS